MTLDATAADELVHDTWRTEIVPQLCDYIAIPALSPAFDPGWERSGHIEDAVTLVLNWIEQRPINGLSARVQRLPGLTPLIVVEVDAHRGDGAASPGEGTVVLYGHLDKQPEMTGWRDDLGPWKPVVDGDRLYGRGGADDGYAAFASLTAIEAVQQAGGSHSRCVMLIEASEESGSPDLPAHVEALADSLGPVDLVVCLDSGCADFETMWLTTSLRGLVDMDVTVEIVTEGLHSGSVGGVIPSTFRIWRRLLDRVESSETGAVLLPSASVEIPPYRVAEAEATAALLGPAVLDGFPLVGGARPSVDDPLSALLARTWQPSLSITGADGLPATENAGNVLRPSTALKLSLRLPPTVAPEPVIDDLRRALTTDVPYGASVSIGSVESAAGWNAPDLEPWLRDALDTASRQAFGQSVQLHGEGGSIPFMGMLGEQFPEAQFVVTGVLGPGSNAHGPNEFLHLGFAPRLTSCLATVLDLHARRLESQ